MLGERGAPAPDDGRVRIFDTTLRDGEQAPGCTMTLDEKLAVARQLARLKVDVIEAGYPAASDGDWEAVHQIAREIGGSGGPAICGLARATARDIDRCWTAVEPAAQARIWSLREASLGLSMAMKEDAKSIAFVEDTAVAPTRLPEFIGRFRDLLRRHDTDGEGLAHPYRSTGPVTGRRNASMSTTGEGLLPFNLRS